MKALRAILVEDVADDALLVERALRRGGYLAEVERVQNETELRGAFTEGPWHAVISDYNLPAFSALRALAIVKAELGDVPFIIVSGSIGEESAVDALKAGAADFIVKTNLDRLITALDRELRDALTRRERRDAIEALEEAVRARDDFLAIASHELRTPLTSLQLQIQRVARAFATPGVTLNPERLRKGWKTISRSADRMQALVERLLDVTRLTAIGHIDLSPDRVDLVKLVQDTVQRTVASVLPETAAIEVKVRGLGAVNGRWDPQRLEMVISNLVDNALKYGGGNPVEVTVEAMPAGARVTVADRGIGIPVEAQRRIFERFERAVPVRHFGGFGLGLWLARQVIEAHGGRILVESSPGVGSTFVLDLPASPPPDPSHITARPSAARRG
jgi:signal transduction histidine kinase